MGTSRLYDSSERHGSLLSALITQLTAGCLLFKVPKTMTSHSEQCAVLSLRDVELVGHIWMHPVCRVLDESDVYKRRVHILGFLIGRCIHPRGR